MTSFNIKVDKEQIADAVSLFEFVGGNTKDAVRIAINRTAKLVRTSTKLPGGGANQRIRKQVNLKSAYINENLKLNPATRSKPSASISIPSRGLLITRFVTDASIATDKKVSWVKAPETPEKGIKVKIKPLGAASVFEGTKGKNLPPMQGKPFYLKLKSSGAIGIARRIAGSRKVHVFHGPSLSQVFDGVKDEMAPVAGEQLETELLDAMRFILAKKYPKE